MYPIFIQVIGFIGLLFVVISLQTNKRSSILKLQLLAASFFTLHFGLLMAWTGATMNALSAIRAYIFNQRDSKEWINNKLVMYLFVLCFWGSSILSWQGYISLLPAISMTFECFALWSKNTKHIRWLFFSARPTWIIYNISVGSYAGLVTEIFIIISLLTAIVRFDILKKENK